MLTGFAKQGKTDGDDRKSQLVSKFDTVSSKSLGPTDSKSWRSVFLENEWLSVFT